MPTSKKCIIKLATEMDEDEVLNKIAEKRDISGARFIKHKDVWA